MAISFSISEFIIGILTGLTVSLVIYVFAKLKKIIMKIGIIVVQRKSKILYIFDDEDKAKEEIYKDAVKSKKIYAFLTRSSCFFADTNNKYNDLLKSEKIDGKFLFVNPDSQYANDRAKEINILPNQLAAPIAVMKKINTKFENIKFELHDESIRFKFFIFDNIMYLYFKTKENASTKTQIYKIGSKSYLFKSFSQQFDDYWEKYHINKTSV